MPNHYLKLEFLKLHFVCFCFTADFQSNPTSVAKKWENSNDEFKIGAIHKRRLLRGGGRGSPLKADLLHKPI